MSSNINSVSSGMRIKQHHQPAAFAPTHHQGFLRQKKSAELAKQSASASMKLAFAGLVLFTFLLYLRPQEMFPEVLGSIPLVKIVAGTTLLAYFIGKLSAGERLTNWPLELWMILAIVLLGVAFTPIAASP